MASQRRTNWVYPLQSHWQAILQANGRASPLMNRAVKLSAAPGAPVDWAKEELGGCKLPDARLQTRLLSLARDGYARPITRNKSAHAKVRTPESPAWRSMMRPEFFHGTYSLTCTNNGVPTFMPHSRSAKPRSIANDQAKNSNRGRPINLQNARQYWQYGQRHTNKPETTDKNIHSKYTAYH